MRGLEDQVPSLGECPSLGAPSFCTGKLRAIAAEMTSRIQTADLSAADGNLMRGSSSGPSADTAANRLNGKRVPLSDTETTRPGGRTKRRRGDGGATFQVNPSAAMEMQRTSVPCVGPAPVSLGEVSPDSLALIASFLPGEMVVTGLLSVSKSLFELEQVRATVTALCFKTGNRFVSPAAPAKAALFVARFPKLASATSVDCRKLTDAAVVALANHCLLSQVTKHNACV